MAGGLLRSQATPSPGCPQGGRRCSPSPALAQPEDLASLRSRVRSALLQDFSLGLVPGFAKPASGPACGVPFSCPPPQKAAVGVLLSCCCQHSLAASGPPEEPPPSSPREGQFMASRVVTGPTQAGGPWIGKSEIQACRELLHLKLVVSGSRSQMTISRHLMCLTI